jgi:hypothetical protein
MNTSGGLYRLAQVIKFGGRTVFVACLVAANLSSYEIAGINPKLFFWVLGLLFVIATEASAWILKGFASDKNQ